MRRDGYGGAEPYHWPVIVRGNAESSCAIRTILDSTPSIHLIETKPARPSRPTGLVLSLKRLPASAQELQLIEEFRCAGGRVLCTAPGEMPGEIEEIDGEWDAEDEDGDKRPAN